MPDIFPKVVGQDTAKLLLSRAVSTRTCPPGYIFSGPSGVGKRTMAMEVGRLLNCRGTQAESCSCRSCTLLREGTHPDIRVYQPEGRVFKVDTIREMREESTYRPYLGAWKVFVLGEADRMNREAANAFLKVLEEPTGPTLFIILHEEESLLPTIESRCVRVPFFPLTTDQVKDALRRANPEAESVDLEASISAGIVSRAQAYLGADFKGERAEAFRIFLSIWAGKLSLSMSLMGDMGRAAGEVLPKLDHFLSFLRDLWLLKEGKEEQIRNVDFVEELRTLTGFSSELLAMVTHRTNEMVRLIGNSNLEIQMRAYLTSILLSIHSEAGI
ncbi:MAG: DNA polymerase III subunit delta' [Dehalococcoidia bacterium]|nr:DNA polymerase III subunit delta' [Dehalococcoidia bacterium]